MHQSKLSAWSSPLKAAYASLKSFVQRRWEKSWIVCQREKGDPNDVYVENLNGFLYGLYLHTCISRA